MFELIIGIIIGLLIGFIIYLLKVNKERKKAIEKSKNIISGQIYEQIVPLLENFKYNPKDAVFIGKPIDYIIFDGLYEGNLKEIIFLEVKNNKSNINKNQSNIKKIIDNKKIKFEILRISNLDKKL